jgi:hypothetical protein
MKSTLRLAYLPALAACLTLAVRLSGADTPAQPAAASLKPAAVEPAAASAATTTPTPHATVPQLPKPLEGVVTQEEYETFVKFQQGLREDPEIKDMNTQIRAKMNEMLELQKKVQLAQQKAVEARPDIKAIADKIMKARAKPPAVGPAGAHPAASGATPPAAPTAAHAAPTAPVGTPTPK